ncbi:glutathione S-transferase [Marinicauda algicola]|uniref:glutathione transferase n=1 Tax=Marinicauda algicola TaxID=2029849 RepID=A0A4S2H496_9PROT|nr:glutathione S-transferase [Marinicauda algicola]TGY90228.1 glutathione S-transferase [Marinicauda algicola]
MITVHHLENSRSQRVLWLLEELQIPYEVKRYERDKRTMLAPKDLYEVHPLGKSPVITENGVTVAETGAIFEYILEAHGAGPLMPERGTPDARAVTYWLHYAEGSAMTPLLLKLVFSRLPENAPFVMKPVVRAVANKTMDGFVDPRVAEHVDYWEKSLEETGWFAGQHFTLADIMMSFPLEAASTRADLSGRPAIRSFLERVHAREAYQAALQRGGPYAYA